MKELATILLKSLSANPDNVVVEERVENNKVYLSSIAVESWMKKGQQL